jgi:hypothetical protein
MTVRQFIRLLFHSSRRTLNFKTFYFMIIREFYLKCLHTAKPVILAAIILFLTNSLIYAEPVETEKWVGTNYTPAYACNQVQFWHDFRADIVEKELAAAKKYFALNTLRVYLHPINFEQDQKNFFENMETFIRICASHGIRPGFTFFDDCHRHEGIYLDRPTEPVKGYHNGRWAASPQDRDRDINHLERYKPYIQQIIGKYRSDDRILWWETFNEPNRSEWSVAMRKAAYGFAKEVNPVQPVLCCWDDSPETDIVNAHNYHNHVYDADGNWKYGVADFSSWDRQAELNPSKGCVFTEAGARWLAPKPNSGEPVDVIRWLESRKNGGKYVPGVYLCWELMVGNSNCRWYGGTPENAPEPAMPWCGMLWPDGTPVSLAEAEAVRQYVTGETGALLFDDFGKPAAGRSTKWKSCSVPKAEPACTPGINRLEAGFIQVPDTPGDSWTDYVLEGCVMLEDGKGNAGLIFRVNDAGCDGADDFNGYYVGFDTLTLYLGKMTKPGQGDRPQWTELQRFDIGKLECGVTPGVWNHVRIEVRGNRIRVWFNRMHESADRQNGLRIDYTDSDSPILRGTVGMRTFKCNAGFDNIIVCPIQTLSFITE